VQTFDTIEHTFSPFSRTRVDGLAIAPDGTVWGVAWPQDGRIVRFDARGRGEVVLELDGPAVGLTFGRPNTQLAGLLFINGEDGVVTMVDLDSMRSVPIATGGTRGDFAKVGLDGRLYVTQSEQVDVFSPLQAPHIIATLPVDGGSAVRVFNRLRITFDTTMRADATVSSATNVNNYELTNLTTGERITIGAAIYNEPTNSIELIFEALQSDPYKLRVLPAIQSAIGLNLEATHVVRFSVLDDASADLPTRITNVRMDRQAGTVSFDLTVTNTRPVSIVAPLRVALTNLPEGVTPLGGGNITGGQLFVDMLTQGRLEPGQSLTRTVHLRNPGGLHLDLPRAALVGVEENVRPQFQTQPSTDTDAGQPYTYQPTVIDPDGAALSFVLVHAPYGATANIDSGEVSWTPGPSIAIGRFELRAYDERGGFGRLVWGVDVNNANRPPVVAT
jgi:hypothetical protein